MDAKNKQVVESVFGDIRVIDDIRTNILFTFPYGNVSLPDVKLRGNVKFCVARMPDECFYTGCYWASYGPKPSDNDPNLFVVPVVIRPWMYDWLNNWSRVVRGKFVTTDSGVIVLDVSNMFLWEGYDVPSKRNYNFDRRRLEKSAAALKAF